MSGKVLRVIFLTGEAEQDVSEENLVTLKVSSSNGNYLLLEGFEKLEQVVALCLQQIDRTLSYQLDFKVEFVERVE
ncbi:hypothetical protein [Chroococcus sp. FPU101]|uniref:hypothetical protein n=1 Tax=Chroococcus sp. FPU101 TaxID=1974212 RepID=UPI001A8EAEC6|nr:hypothetical protein [Chroococcus sp. FPU101]GFE71814.1 hypothetical protein CFPU101_44240 [Chroococcus sp. FPU101]